MLQKALAACLICLITTTSGWPASQRDGAPADQTARNLPSLVLIDDEAGTFERLSRHQYEDGRPFDRDLDRLGKEISPVIAALHGSDLSPLDRMHVDTALASPTSALLLPFSAAQNNPALLALARSLLGTGRFIYIYGRGTSLQSISDLFGVNITGLKAAADPTDLAKRQESQQFELDNYSVIGFAQSKKGLQTRLGTADTRNPAVLREDALRRAVSWELDGQNHVRIAGSDEGEVAAQAYSLVYSWISHGTTWYAGGGPTLKAALLVDWYLEKRSDETDPTYDYFAIAPRYEVKDGAHLQGSPYYLESFYTKHTKRWRGDQLYDWSPPTQTASSFSVNLNTVTATWTFSTTNEAKLYTQVDQLDDWVSFQFDKAFPYTLDMPLHVRPGSGWASTGTLFGLNAEQQVLVNGPFGHSWLKWTDFLIYDY